MPGGDDIEAGSESAYFVERDDLSLGYDLGSQGEEFSNQFLAAELPDADEFEGGIRVDGERLVVGDCEGGIEGHLTESSLNTGHDDFMDVSGTVCTSGLQLFEERVRCNLLEEFEALASDVGAGSANFARAFEGCVLLVEFAEALEVFGPSKVPGMCDGRQFELL